MQQQFESCIKSYVKVKLNDNQFGALVSWSFNVGCENAQMSTLVRELNAGQDPNNVAAQQLPQWDKAGGKVQPGLVKRRAAEVNLFNTASSTTAIPC